MPYLHWIMKSYCKSTLINSLQPNNPADFYIVQITRQKHTTS